MRKIDIVSIYEFLAFGKDCSVKQPRPTHQVENDGGPVCGAPSNRIDFDKFVVLSEGAVALRLLATRVNNSGEMCRAAALTRVQYGQPFA